MKPPQLRFPVGRPFEVPDQFNGKERGTWYYRAVQGGHLHGPFHTELAALNDLQEATIEPYQDVVRDWWWTEPNTNNHHGPYRLLRDAEASILEYLHSEKS